MARNLSVVLGISMTPEALEEFGDSDGDIYELQENKDDASLDADTLDFLSRLQSAHDMAENSAQKEDGDFIKDFITNMQQLADFKFNVNPINTITGIPKETIVS